jgi:hypothetical protein
LAPVTSGFLILQLDILVNNAGRSQRADWEDIEMGVDREMFDLNVFGVVALSRIVVRYFEKKKEGHIVVTSSLAGVRAVPYSGSYTGAKHAVHVSCNVLFLSSSSLPFFIPLPSTTLKPVHRARLRLPEASSHAKGEATLRVFAHTPAKPEPSLTPALDAM